MSSPPKNRREYYQEIPETVEDILEIATRKSVKTKVYLKHYWKILLLLALFYAIPSIQFVVVQYLERSEATVYCYYNFKCNAEVLGISSFNNVVSNSGYIVLGLIFLLIVRSREKEEIDLDEYEEDDIKLSADLDVRDAELPLLPLRGPTGLHRDQSLFYCLGWTLILEGIFSALYHVCPSRINFQFDTTFMLIGSALLFMTLYQKRQPTIISGPYRTFGFFGAVIFLNVSSLLFRGQAGTKVFWVIVFFLLTYVSIHGSIHLYYFERLEFDKTTIPRLLRRLRHPERPRAPLRLMIILFGNAVNYSLTITTAVKGYTHMVTQDFPSFILGLTTLNSFIYIGYYITMKYKSRERVYLKVWLCLLLSIVYWTAGIYFYNIAVSDKFLTPEESALLNKPCVLFSFFDYHDIWHFLSSLGVFFLFLMVYLLDIDLHENQRSAIKVF